MAWKEVYKRDEVKVFGVDDTTSGDWIHASGLNKNKQYRVTIEEEVKECCASWRGNTVTGTIHAPNGTTSFFGFSPMHCPECGEKL